ncbi:MAG: hypothetical protein NTZ04_03560 [Chloroflexi bacterium]|nr:hypothetical protein [Chloroflexota bacterium]
MRLDDLVILTLHFSDNKMIAGRTLLQKTLYFLNAKLNLGVEFASHYYGPYSSDVAESIARLNSAGILEESIEYLQPLSFGVTFEPRRFTYRLTDTGKSIAEIAERRNETEAEAIKGILDRMKNLGVVDDYKSLSIAAKMHRILKIEKKPMTASQVLEEAKALDWRIEKGDADGAVVFLKGMDLVMEFEHPAAANTATTA